LQALRTESDRKATSNDFDVVFLYVEWLRNQESNGH